MLSRYLGGFAGYDRDSIPFHIPRSGCKDVRGGNRLPEERYAPPLASTCGRIWVSGFLAMRSPSRSKIYQLIK